VLSSVIILVVSVMLVVGVNVPVQVIPPSDELKPVTLPFSTVRSAVVKLVTFSVKVNLTVAVSPVFNAVSEIVIALDKAGAVLSIVTAVAEEVALTLPATSVDFTVMLCAPSESEDVVTDHLPCASAVVEAISVFPPVSYRLIIANASVVPENSNVLALVIPSELELPVSLAVASVGALGVVGEVVSIVTDRLLEALLTLPAVSLALAVRVCAPSLKVELVIDHLPEPSAVVAPSTVLPSVSYKVTVALASEVPLKIGVVVLVRSSLLLVPLSSALLKSGVPGALGAVVSIVISKLLEALLTLPAVSVTLAVSVCAPSLKVVLVILQLPLPSAVVVPSTVLPSVS